MPLINDIHTPLQDLASNGDNQTRKTKIMLENELYNQWKMSTSLGSKTVSGHFKMLGSNLQKKPK